VRSLPDAIARAIGMNFGLLGYQEQTTNHKSPSFAKASEGKLVTGY